MSPEQARGDVDLVDERTDVFGLGAILCEILTGKPPFLGIGPEVERKAQTGRMDEAFTALDACGADAELVLLAKRCLAAEPWDRPRHAGVVAEATTAYAHSVTQKLRDAELERAAAEARAAEEARTREMAEAKAAEERKRRRATLALAAVVLMLVVVGGSGLAWWWQERTAVLRDVEAAWNEAIRHERSSRMTEARAALERAEGRLAGAGPETLRHRLRQMRADLDLAAAIDQIRLDKAEFYKGQGAFDLASTDRRYADAFRKYDIDVNEMDLTRAIRRLRESPIRETLLEALDDWIGVKPDATRAGLRAVADGADENAWRLTFRDAFAAKDMKRLKEMAAKPEALSQTPGVLVWLATALNDAGLSTEAADLLQRAQHVYPGDFWINFKLGSMLMWNVRPPRNKEASLYYHIAVAIRPANAAAHSCLGGALGLSGNFDEGIRECQKAIELDPSLWQPHSNLASVLARKGDVDASIQECRKAIEIDPKSIVPHRIFVACLRDKRDLDGAVLKCRQIFEMAPDDAPTCDQLGWILRQQGKHEEALEACRKAVKLQPKEPSFRNTLAYVLKDKGDADGAAAEFRRAIELDSRFAPAHYGLGQILQAQGDLEGGVAELRKTIELEPKGVGAHFGLGQALKAKGDREGALSAFREAVGLDPAYVPARQNFVKSLGAKAALEEVRLAWEKSLRDNPPKHDAWFGYAELCLFLGREEEYRRARTALLERFGETREPTTAERTARACLLLPAEPGELDRAAALSERALAAGSKHWGYPWFQLAAGLAEYRRGNYQEAIRLLREAIPRVGITPRLVLAMALYKGGQREEGCRTFTAVTLDYDWAEAKADELDVWIRHVLRREAERLIMPELPAFLAGTQKPRDNAEWAALSASCWARGLFVTMARRYAEGFAADPKLADNLPAVHRYNAACLAALAGCGQGEEAAKLEPKEGGRWRKQARDWLRADLTAHANRLENGKPEDRGRTQRQLEHWLRDADLAGIRDADAISSFDAEEKKACRKLWDDVNALLKTSREKIN
jgi:tetratricopeptide (TPR) repeat protein